jgi:transposase
MGEVHVLSGPERRRRWSVEQKQALIAAAFAPGAIVRDVARQSDVCTSQIYRWRRELRTERPGFAEMVVIGAGAVEQRQAVPAIEIAFAGKVQVRIPPLTNPELAAAIVKALTGR